MTTKSTSGQSTIQSGDQECEPRKNDQPKLLEQIVNKVPSFGILICFCSCFFTITAPLMVKWIPNVHSIVLILIRSFFQTLIYGMPIAIKRKSFFGSTRLNVILVCCGLAAYLSGWLYYESVRLIPFGDATSIAQSAPIYTSIFAYFLLNESFSWMQVLCLCLSLTGVGLIAKPEMICNLIVNGMEGNSASMQNSMHGTMLAFLSAICFAICYVIIRKLVQFSVILVLFWLSAGCFVCSVVHLTFLRLFYDDLSVRLPYTVEEWSFTMIGGLSALIGQHLINLALKVEEAGPISLVRTGDILLSFILQAFILQNEPVQLSSVLGAFIIFAAITLAALKKWAKDGQHPPKLLVWMFRIEKDVKTKKSSHPTLPQVMNLNNCDNKLTRF